MSGDDKSTEASSAAADGAAADDQKAQFLAALERKKAGAGGHAGTGHGDSKIHEAHGPAGAKRQFRRKSGG